ARRPDRGRARDDGLRRGLLPRARGRHAADRRRGRRDRSPDHAAHRPAVDPRRDPLPADAPRMNLGGFQSFVAWRYLMARPRRVSNLPLWLAIVFGAAGVAHLLLANYALGAPRTDAFPTPS